MPEEKGVVLPRVASLCCCKQLLTGRHRRFPAPQLQRFYMPEEKGVILPGQAKTFRFSFKSPQPGMFTELWVLETAPALKTPLPLLTLRGVAYSDDRHIGQRGEIAEELDTKEKHRKVTLVLCVF